MKKLLFSICLLILAFPQLIFGQDGWIKEFPGPEKEYSGNIIRTSDGNYVFSVTATGGLGAGFEGGTYLIKLDINGNVLSIQNVVPGGTISISPHVIETNDNGLFVLTSKGYNTAGGLTIFQPFIKKIDTNGNEVWADFYDFGNPNFTTRIHGIHYLSDGNFIISGTDSLAINVHLRKLDENFNTIWDNTSPSSKSLHSFVESPTGDIIAGGRAGYVSRLDTDGNLIWETNLPNFTTETIFKIFLLSDGSIMAFTFETSMPFPHQRQIKLDGNGNLIWDKVIVPANFEGLLYSPIQVEDGFICTGFIENNIPEDGTAIYLIKTDLNGELVWENQINHRISTSLEHSRSITATDDNGIMGVGFFNIFGDSESFIFKTDSLGYVYPNQITGNVGRDEQSNCLVDSSEVNLANWVISASNSDQTYYDVTDSLGNYQIPLDTGDYVLTIHAPNVIWDACENDINISVSSNSTVEQDFPMEAILDCPLLVVSSTLFTARPCFDNNKYIVNYCNEGTITAEDAYVEIFANDDLSYANSSINLSMQDGNKYTFNLGDVSSGQCGSFSVDFMVDCDATIGESACITSHIFPDTFCVSDPSWNGAFVMVDVICDDTHVNFYLENTGNMAMPTAKEYIVVEDAILLMTNDFQLLSGEIDSFSILANGSTFTLIAEQVENAPGDPFPTAWTEGCGTNALGSFSLGYINQFSLGDNIPYFDRDCRTISASIDPNDKQGFPLGYDDEHYIRPNTNLEYQIRFQNTGTDTAFTVVIRDTIAPELDIPSIQVGASSHSYEWRIYGENILEFTFNIIMLPDSNVNEPASHGFIEFKISQKEDLPLGTVIKNKAAIYFDYNDPIITNETFHTLGENFITVSLQRPIEEDFSLLVRPNPLQEFAIFEMKKEIKNGLFELYDVSGKLAWQQKFNGSEFELKRNDLNAGIYFYKISENGNAINSGKIIIN